MTTKDFNKLYTFSHNKSVFYPTDENAKELINETEPGEQLVFKRVVSRDIKKHAAFRALLAYIYKLLPKQFQDKVPSGLFLQYIQAGKGDFKKGFEFGLNGGFVFPIFNSISFAKMSDAKFEKYIKELLPFIYTNIIAHYYDLEKAQRIIAQIERQFESLIKTL